MQEPKDPRMSGRIAMIALIVMCAVAVMMVVIAS